MKNKNSTSTEMTKSYYSIGEVAEMYQISVEVLRKWERDFPKIIRPLRTKGETRLYDHKQVEKVGMVKRLLHTEGMTVAGAQKKLGARQSQEETHQEVLTHLYNIRKQLQDIVDQIDATLQLSTQE